MTMKRIVMMGLVLAAAMLTNDAPKVVFIGDSITHFWETNGKAQWSK